MKTMRRLSMILALTLMMVAFVGCSNDPADEPVEEPAEQTEATEGAVVTTGSGVGFNDESTVEVEVTTEDGVITSVVVVSEDEDLESIDSVHVLEDIPAAIVEAGSTDGVEVISGATMTSTAILDAVNDALAQQ